MSSVPLSLIVLDELDDALIALRRLFSSPTAGPADRGRWPDVEVSTVLVAHALRRLRADGAPVTVARVADSLGVARSTASRLVQRALAAGVLAGSTPERDARQLHLTLTELGECLVAEARSFRHAILRQALTDLTDDEARVLAGQLRRLAGQNLANPGRTH